MIKITPKKIIHQVFIPVREDKPNITDFSVFVKSSESWREFAKQNDYQYILWTEGSIDRLLNRYNLPTKFYLPNGELLKFAKIDFARYVFLAKFGGLYVDLDVLPKEGFEDIFKRPIILNKWRKTYYNKDGTVKKYGKYEIQNGLMKFPKGYTEDLITYCLGQIKEKSQIPCYMNRKVRYFLHTTGNNMFKRL